MYWEKIISEMWKWWLYKRKRINFHGIIQKILKDKWIWILKDRIFSILINLINKFVANDYLNLF